MWMNRYEVEDTRFRFANHPVLARATRFLYEFVEETDANSDGWSSWPLPGRAAGQLMDLIQRGDSATTEGAISEVTRANQVVHDSQGIRGGNEVSGRLAGLRNRVTASRSTQHEIAPNGEKWSYIMGQYWVAVNLDNYVEWLEYLIQHFIAPWGYKLNGAVVWHGEDSDDIGRIVVTDNVVRVLDRVEFVQSGSISNDAKKLATIQDFLGNQFDCEESQYTAHELFEMLDHVCSLLATKDGRLADENV